MPNKRIRAIQKLDRDEISPGSLMPSAAAAIFRLALAAEEAGLALDWETLKVKVRVKEPDFAYVRASARIL